ncbi:MAG: magnesium chelatase subunit D [Tabrizicola sp.]|uniref:magnesium chelatase subunit D n=1 Tax=Tabrizicola sp. TaxID=2005166 RepID=UPI002ABC2441|nr:magnesium chelatase subunit D [Tabrizicola sp.]MDZ4086465.1 magnesium chelatase subunit D [Tabrizicola sp.]
MTWARLSLCLRILAVDPVGMGGLWLRSRAGPIRDIATTALSQTPFDRPQRRLSASIDDLALLGGPDPVATLAAGRPVHRPGLLSDPALLILPMAETAPPSLTARLAQALDKGHHALIALDEAAEDGEGLPSALTDRLGLFLTLDGERSPRILPKPIGRRTLAKARALYPLVTLPDDLTQALAQLAARLGITSTRALLTTRRAARAIAALDARLTVTEDDLIQAAELGLAHRALPEAEAQPDQPPEPPPDQPDQPDTPDQQPEEQELQNLADLLIEAAQAALPPDILAKLQSDRANRAARGASGTGSAKAGNRRGRPLPSRPGRPDGRSRIDLVATLRQAAPWQVLRKQADTQNRALIVHRSDFRLKRYKEVSDRVLIFIVDASGSSAMARLGEAKGAVELMLAQAYSRRDHVALVVLRGTKAELLLPPTRSLTTTKARLRGLPGGGGTPLASGLATALDTALRARRQGMTPSLALLTDGRANIALSGQPDRALAQADAEQIAQAIRAAGIAAVTLDVANRPQPALAQLSTLMNSRYVPLPRADARAIAATLA